MENSLLSDEERFEAKRLKDKEEALGIIYTSHVLEKAKQLYDDEGHINTLLDLCDETIVLYCNRAEAFLKIEEQDSIGKGA